VAPSPILLIGNPENRRVELFQAALVRAGETPARVLPWLDLLQDPRRIEAELAPGTLVRIESPGENFEVERRLLALGGVEDADRLDDEKGRILFPREWFAGFASAMRRLAQAGPQVRWFNHPDEIVSMFDKPACKRMLPDCIAPLPDFEDYEGFVRFAREARCPRFFVKLPTGSSASGVAAWEYNRTDGQERAHSTVEFVRTPSGETRFYNSLRIRRHADPASIRTVLDFLFRAGALVEPWIPKAVHEGRSYDLRVLVVEGRRRHAVARSSRSPMTNLHLGNRRVDCDDLELDEATWEAVDAVVERTMARFPRSLYAGLDILLPRGGGAPVLLEVNAFGDLLPGLVHDGRDTYGAEIEAMRRSEARHG